MIIETRLNVVKYSLTWREKFDGRRWTVQEQTCLSIGAAERLLTYLRSQDREVIVRAYDASGRRVDIRY